MATLKRKAEQIDAAEAKKPKKDASLTSFFGAPKVTPAKTNGSTLAEANGAAAKFDKEKWVDSLTAEQKKLLKLEIDTLDRTWLFHLKEELVTQNFLNLKKFLQAQIDAKKKIYPPLEEVYSWSRHTPLNTVKVVIIGQDPYHNANQAHGLSFSVRPPTPAPPSLKNMFVELKNEYPDFKPPPNNGGLLTPWADQGVLLLNACLTVEAHQASSHANKGWESFTQKVIDTVAKFRTHGVVFLAWGAPAQKRCSKVSAGKHVVMKAVHPSPLSAHKGWFGCGHFKAANEWLKDRYGNEGIINWSLDKPAEISKPKTNGTPIKATGNLKQEVPAQATQKEPAPKMKKSATEEFGIEEDEDALEALEELAKNDALEVQVESNKAEETQNEAAKIEEVEKETGVDEERLKTELDNHPEKV